AGGRTGVRGADEALALAERVAREPRLRWRGVSGYEGSYGADRRPETVAAVRRYLAGLADVATRVLDAHELEDPIVTAGGSMWFDLVADELAQLTGRARVVLRSGAFRAHDDVFYAGNSALALQPALTVFSRVVPPP